MTGEADQVKAEYVKAVQVKADQVKADHIATFRPQGQTTPAVDVTTPMDTSPLPPCAPVPVPTALSPDPATTAPAPGSTDDSTTAS